MNLPEKDQLTSREGRDVLLMTVHDLHPSTRVLKETTNGSYEEFETQDDT
jgi:hypothetical protein